MSEPAIEFPDEFLDSVGEGFEDWGGPAREGGGSSEGEEGGGAGGGEG